MFQMTSRSIKAENTAWKMEQTLNSPIWAKVKHLCYRFHVAWKEYRCVG